MLARRVVLITMITCSTYQWLEHETQACAQELINAAGAHELDDWQSDAADYFRQRIADIVRQAPLFEDC